MINRVPDAGMAWPAMYELLARGICARRVFRAFSTCARSGEFGG